MMWLYEETKQYTYISHHSVTQKLQSVLKLISKEDKNIHIAMSQDNSSHGIDIVIPDYFYFDTSGPFY